MDIGATFDKIFEGGVSVVNKYFDWGISANQKESNAAARAAEEARVAQLNTLYDQQAGTVPVNIPAWAIPAGLAALVTVFYLKKK